MVTVGKKCVIQLQRGWASLRTMNDVHHAYIRGELNQARGLIPLLMKRRNGGQWTADERATLLHDLRALSNLSPYLIPIIMPGGIFLLPLVAYWMDQRRHERKQQDEQKLP
jgi:hypothetical protein